MVEILVPLSFFALIFGVAYLRNRERLAMIEKGIHPSSGDGPRPFMNLKWGLLLLGCGLGLLSAWLLVRFAVGPHMAPAGVHHAGAFNPVFLYFAMIAIGGGLGLFFSYRIEKKEWVDKTKV